MSNLFLLVRTIYIYIYREREREREREYDHDREVAQKKEDYVILTESRLRIEK